MRVFGLISVLVVPFVSAATLGWWLATIVVRGLARRLERTRAFARGPATFCADVLLACGLIAAVVGSAVAMALLWLIPKVPDFVGLSGDHPIRTTWIWLTWAATALTAGAAIAGAVAQGCSTMAACRRRWQLLDLADPDPRVEACPPKGGRRIVILCDGTSNRPDQMDDGRAAPTNIWKLSNTLIHSEVQTVWYQAGVGSDTSSTADDIRRTNALLTFFGANTAGQVAATGSRVLRMFEGAFGTGISETIARGYTEIVRQYRPGDHIYLVGFSRGAYTARCIAGVISKCGLLRAENIRYASEMVQIYRTRADPEDHARIRPSLCHRDPTIAFVGVFDTVASLGVPLWGWWFRTFPIWQNKGFISTEPAAACQNVYHALAMDERRSEFMPTLYTRPEQGLAQSTRSTLEQVWFRGAHADIGGGYAECGLSDITLGWMMDAMQKHGLAFVQGARASLKPDKLAPLHDEMVRNPSWTLLGSWPRWHPAPGDIAKPDSPTLHSSVRERAVIVEAETGRLDLRHLKIDECVTLTVEAPRTWDRSGLIIDTGGCYRVTYLDARWRDSNSKPCGPDGQAAHGLFDLRRWWRWGRRLPHHNWMQLVITVAHPRPWPLKEKNLRALLRLLVWNDPHPLVEQLAPIGEDLDAPDKAIMLNSRAPGGLLYLFANDWWQTASNNSGGVRLKIERLARPDESRVWWTLDEKGLWHRTTPGAHPGQGV